MTFKNSNVILKKTIKKNELVNFSKIQLSNKNINLNNLNLLKVLPMKANKDLKKGEILKLKFLKKINIGLIISCRLNSTRLPRKAIIKLGKTTSIERCINQVKQTGIKCIIIATSKKKENLVLKKIAKRNNINFFMGSDKNLVLRNLQAANKYNLDHLIRVTGDSPLISYELISELISNHLKRDSDYSYNDNLPLGTRSEIIKVKALKFIYENTKTSKYGEYLSLYFKNNKKLIKCNKVDFRKEYNFKKIRLNLDYESDYNFINNLLNFFNYKKTISLNEIFLYLTFFHKENKYILSKYQSPSLSAKIKLDTKIHD